MLGVANGNGWHVQFFGGNSAAGLSVPLGGKDLSPNCRRRMMRRGILFYFSLLGAAKTLDPALSTWLQVVLLKGLTLGTLGAQIPSKGAGLQTWSCSPYTFLHIGCKYGNMSYRDGVPCTLPIPALWSSWEAMCLFN